MAKFRRLQDVLAGVPPRLCSWAKKKVSEYDQEMLQSHTADQPMTPRGRVTEHVVTIHL